MKPNGSLAGIIAIAAWAIVLSACQTPSQPPTARPIGTTSATEPQVKPVRQAVTSEGARNLANNCFTCHGPSGRSPGSIPSLTTLSASDIVSRLKRFRGGDTPSTVMGRLAKGYSDAEIEALANYIAGQKK